jgi:hypothetical protein
MNVKLNHGYRAHLDRFGRPWLLTPGNRPVDVAWRLPASKMELETFCARFAAVAKRDRKERRN